MVQFSASFELCSHKSFSFDATYLHFFLIFLLLSPLVVRHGPSAELAKLCAGRQDLSGGYSVELIVPSLGLKSIHCSLYPCTVIPASPGRPAHGARSMEHGAWSTQSPAHLVQVGACGLSLRAKPLQVRMSTFLCPALPLVVLGIARGRTSAPLPSSSGLLGLSYQECSVHSPSRVKASGCTSSLQRAQQPRGVLNGP